MLILLLVVFCFVLICFFFSSECESLDLGINTKHSWQFPFCFHFYSHIIIMALKAKVWINNNELFLGLPHMLTYGGIWINLKRNYMLWCLLFLPSPLEQWLWGRIPLFKITRFSQHFLRLRTKLIEILETENSYVDIDTLINKMKD